MAQDLQGWDIVSGVGITALIVAAARAVETNQADGLVRDPLAEAFVRAANAPIPFPAQLCKVTDSSSELNQRWKEGAVAMGARSKFFDEYFADSWATGIRQAVLLAAGLDSRAFRLVWPTEFTVYEIDQPKVLSFKDRVLDEQQARPRCTRRVVAIDLRENWTGALLEAGFDASQPTAWLAEGLLLYLPPQGQRRLLDNIHDLSTPGSRLALNHVNVTPALLDRARERKGELGVDISTLIATEPGDDPSEYLADQGWEVSSLTLSEIIEPYRWRLSSLTPATQTENDDYYYFHTACLRRGPGKVEHRS